jgi:TPR repeat protein
LTTSGEPASAEHKEALQFVMTGLRTKGSALTADEFRAYEENIRYAAHLDIAPAILILADNLKARKSPEAFDWFYYAANTKHNAEAMMKLAWLYYDGEKDQPPDRETAFKWFKLAYEAGDTAAGVMAANCYLRGIGTAKDEDASIRILVPLADSGVASAKTTLGQCYYNGLGQFAALPQATRDEKARTYFEQAVRAGDWAACGHLGVLYETGRGVERDWQAAAKLYLKGVEHDNPPCMYYYALALENHGSEIKKLFGRQDKAETYYKRAAAAGITEAVQWCVEHHVKF